MTGLSGLGPSDFGNPGADILRQNALDGTIMPEVRRALWSRAGEYQQDSTLQSILTGGGVTAAVGKGLADANLALFRGVHWMGSHIGLDFGMREQDVPKSLYDLLPQDDARVLASRLASANVMGKQDVFGAKIGDIGEVTGEILALIGSGGLTTFGKIGKSSDVISKASRLATGVPGTTLRAFTAPGRLAGQQLLKVPQIAQYTKLANALPETIGAMSGFGLYNFLSRDGGFEERGAALLHGLVAGAALKVAGEVATMAERKVLDMALSPDQIAGLGRIGATLRGGEMPSWSQIKAGATQTGAKSLGALVENTGFAMLNEGFWQAAADGDIEGAVRAYVETLPAALLARTGNPDAWRGYRRESPDLNDAGLRRQMVVVRSGQDPKQAGPAPAGPAPAGQPTAPVTNPKQIQNTDTIYAGETRAIESGMSEPGKAYGWPQQVPGQGSTSAGAPERAGDPFARTLLHAGWEIPDGIPPRGQMDLEFPGGGKVSVQDDGQMVVTRAVFRTVRGDSEAARMAELDTPNTWAKLMIDRSYSQDYAGSFAQMAKQQIDTSIDIDQARSLLGSAPKGSVMHKALSDIVDGNAPYGPVTVSGLEVASTIRAYREKAGTDENSKRVNEWLKGVAEDVHRWALVEKYGEKSLGGQIAAQAKVSMQDFVDEAAGGIHMEGAVADEFARDLAAISMMRRMGGEVQFGAAEAWAGGPWKGQDGQLYHVGLDGKTYSRSWPHAEGEPWVEAQPLKSDVTIEPSREIKPWMDLAGALRRQATPSTGLALLETALVTANSGDPKSRSIAELRQFLGQLDPQQVAPMLTPESLDALGMSLGRIGSGHSTAAREIELFQQAVAKPPAAQEPQIDAALEAEINQMEGREGEQGSMMNPLEPLGELGDMVSGAAGRSADYLFETQAEVFRKALPSSTYSQRGRQHASLGRTIRGEAQAKWGEALGHLASPGARGLADGVKKSGRRKWAEQWMVYENGSWREAKTEQEGDIQRWELLTDNRIALPADAPQWQRDYVEGHRAVNEHLYDKARMFGAVRGAIGEPDSARPLAQTKNYVTERRQGRDVNEVYGDYDTLLRWFEHLVNHPLNQEVRIKTPSGQQRKLRVSDLEQQWKDENKRMTEPESADIAAAFEHFRLLPHVPMRWRDAVTDRTYEMRESDVTDVMADVVKRQSKRVAAIKVWGQDLSPQRRQAALDWLKANESTIPEAQRRAVLENVQMRTGPTAAAREWGEQLRGPGSPALSKDLKDQLVVRARQWIKTLQGSPPPAAPAARVLRNIDIIPRALGASLAFSWDIVEGLVGMPLHYGGLVRTMKAWKKFFANPNEAVRLATRLGSLSREMGELIWGEGHSATHMVANAAGKVADVTEGYKGAQFSTLADVILAEWAAGRPLSSDYLLLNELRFEPREAKALVSGEAPRGLQNQFRNEFVQQLSSRREKGEGSMFADDANAQAMMRYGVWSSARGGQLLRAKRDIDQAAEAHGTFSKQAMLARARAASLLGTFTASGALGSLVGLLISAMMSGDMDKGSPRWWREASDSPGWFLAKSLMGQALVGPTGRTLGSMTEPDNARSIASLNVASQLVYSTGKMLEAANRGDVSFLTEFAVAQGYVPFYSTVGTRLIPRIGMWSAAAISGEALSAQDDAMSDRDLVTEFINRPGAPKGFIGLPKDGRARFSPTKDASFYAHMKDAMAAFYQKVGGAKPDQDFAVLAEGGFKAALESLDKARQADGVKPGSIAGYIRSQRHFNGMDAETRLEFMSYAGAERMKRMRLHDRMLDLMAKAAADPDMPVSDPEWEVQIARFRALIDVDDIDMSVVEAALNGSKMDLAMNPNAETPRLTDLASAIAASDFAVSKVFAGEKAEFFTSVKDHGQRSQYIEYELIDRAINRSFRDQESK